MRVKMFLLGVLLVLMSFYLFRQKWEYQGFELWILSLALGIFFLAVTAMIPRRVYYRRGWLR